MVLEEVCVESKADEDKDDEVIGVDIDVEEGPSEAELLEDELTV